MVKLYIGNLPNDVQRRELENVFGHYGRIYTIEVISKDYKPAFAFIDFGNKRDAMDAIDGEDGRLFGDRKMLVTFSKEQSPHGRSRSRSRSRSRGRYGRDSHDFIKHDYDNYHHYDSRDDRERYYDDYDERRRRRGGGEKERRNEPYDSRNYTNRFYDNFNNNKGRKLVIKHTGQPRRSCWHVIVSGLPTNYSWQDLKDLMRKGGKVIYTEVNGVEGDAEYENEEQMNNAITVLNGYNVEGKTITVVKDIRFTNGNNNRDHKSPDRSRSESKK